MDHEDGQIALAKMLIQEWKHRRVVGDKVPNKFNVECSSTYKEWLKKNLSGTIKPSPNVLYCIKDIKAEKQVLLH